MPLIVSSCHCNWGSDTPFVSAFPATKRQVGIDLNTENFLTTSDNTVVANPRYYRTIKGKLAKAQRTLARRQRRAKKEHRSLRNSKNYQQQRLVVAKISAKVADRRRNFLHQLSTTPDQEPRSRSCRRNCAVRTC